ncbi:secretin N-terminal domain-containing protein [Silvimonas amylolytica]|uniref:Type II and III secretion system protein n=1 Tax=Silvimonas amylolytica TaxID=449663 RepID=A0ABQ2PS65_9NEIS|nr:secretin N-terminal domain-containing protein [Silvimonas amylolytica]GGP27794.1 type II and III secretion system protein [Silvimonas amylolytica]
MPSGHVTGSLPPWRPAQEVSSEPALAVVPKSHVYSVVAYKLPVTSLLFTLARDARINLDVSPQLTGEVSLNAHDQTLPQILERISHQVPLYWFMNDGVLTVMPDQQIWRTYHVDYFNLSRSVKASVSLANSVGRSAGVTDTATDHNINSSTTDVQTTSDNAFWVRLETQLKTMLQVNVLAGPDRAAVMTPGMLAAAAADTAVRGQIGLEAAERLSRIEKNLADASKGRTESPPVAGVPSRPDVGNLVLVHPETGVVSVFAKAADHKQVAEYLHALESSAARQVLIEATIVEVLLSDRYQAGIDWGWLTATDKGWQLAQQTLGASLVDPPLALVGYSSQSFNFTVKLLEQFGRTRVLSSPKIVALNNQPAVMKVVDEQVYFTLEQTEEQNSDGQITKRRYESKLHTVPVGLVLQVLTQISGAGEIALNVRPTITNIRSWVDDPAVALLSRDAAKPVVSQVPILQIREFDATLHVPSGQLAILGGLIQDVRNDGRTGIPGLSRIPGLGDLFSYRDDTARRVELVIFLRPRVLDNRSEMLADSGVHIPDNHFFDPAVGSDLSAWQSGSVNAPRVQP